VEREMIQFHILELLGDIKEGICSYCSLMVLSFQRRVFFVLLKYMNSLAHLSDSVCGISIDVLYGFKGNISSLRFSLK